VQGGALVDIVALVVLAATFAGAETPAITRSWSTSSATPTTPTTTGEPVPPPRTCRTQRQLAIPSRQTKLTDLNVTMSASEGLAEYSQSDSRRDTGIAKGDTYPPPRDVSCSGSRPLRNVDEAINQRAT